MVTQRTIGHSHWSAAVLHTPRMVCHQLYPHYTVCRYWRAFSPHPLSKGTRCPEPSHCSCQSCFFLSFCYFLLCPAGIFHHFNEWRMDSVGQQLTELMPHFGFFAQLQLPQDQILVPQTSQVDVGMEHSTRTSLQHFDLSSVIGICRLLLFYILAATFVDLLIILHLLPPSEPFQIWIFSQEQALLSISKHNPYSHL